MRARPVITRTALILNFELLSVLPYHLFKEPQSPLPIPCRHQAPQPLQVPPKPRRIELVVLHHQNLVMPGGKKLLLLLDQLLAEPLPRPQADDLDRNADLGLRNAEFGLRIADFGIRISDLGLRIGGIAPLLLCSPAPWLPGTMVRGPRLR